MARFYHDMWARLMDVELSSLPARVAFRVAKLAVDRLSARLQKNAPEYLAERVRGMAEAAKLPADEAMLALVLPDLMPMLQSMLNRLSPGRFVDPMAVPRFGCSSFVNAGQSFLVGRNLDFPGVAYWDRYPVLQLTRVPDALRYLAFTTAGVPIGGITGINEARVYVALHQHYSRRFSWKGRLPFAVAEEILMRARSVDEAIEILRGADIATAWAFVLADGKNRDMAIAEVQPGKVAVRRPTGGRTYLSHSNYFHDAELRSDEYATSARMNWDNQARCRRLGSLIQAQGYELSPAAAVRALSDSVDPYYSDEKVVNRTVSQLYNIQSLVLDPENLKAWTAEGDCPIHLRQYAEIDLAAVLDGREGRTGKSLSAFCFEDPKKAAAKELYSLSFVAAFDGDPVLSSSRMKQSLDASFCPEGAQVAGVLALKRDETAVGLDLFRAGRAWIEKHKNERFPPEYFELGIFEARALDLLGRRDEALKVYRVLVENPELEDAHLKAIAKRAAPYTRTSLERVLIPFSTYTPFA